MLALSGEQQDLLDQLDPESLYETLKSDKWRPILESCIDEIGDDRVKQLLNAKDSDDLSENEVKT